MKAVIFAFATIAAISAPAAWTLSTEGCAGRPYYVVQWREATAGMSVFLR